MRRAKIICTLGPASADPAVLRKMVLAGMDVARLNFSHGNHDSHARAIAAIRKISEEIGRPIGILQDLGGPKIRTGPLEGHQPVLLEPGNRIVLSAAAGMGDAERVRTTVDLSSEVKPGEPLLLADGMIGLRVEEIRGQDIACRVEAGGLLGENKGINLPDSKLSIPAITAKDIADLEFGLEQGVDFIAMSFVRQAQDLYDLRNKIATWANAHEGRGMDTLVVAKLEKPQAMEHLDEILDACESVMVARGDLGVEMPPEKVPALQKKIIAEARRKRRPVITATQMLESMTEHPRPTRAEASDVANAVLDGTDALMLSGETAAGHYPVEAVAMMARIIVEAEAMPRPPALRPPATELSIPETIAESVAHGAEDLKMAAIAVFTSGGSTAYMTSSYRPPCPIYGLSPDARTRSRLTLYWGVTPISSPEILTTDEMLRRAELRLLDLNLVRLGDIIAIVAGSPFGVPGRTNLMKILRAGE
ncbi:MAG TPA: pyruvate kinase [Candidatus Dormibacteraeota bacterium]|nr:pyruvate kinase [Candidatus Dormibacteraeota bacterium]